MAEAIKIHLACPDCGSSDALTEYDDGSTYCFSCSSYGKSKKERQEVHYMDDKGLKLDAGVFPTDGLPDRKLTADTCKRFGVKLS